MCLILYVFLWHGHKNENNVFCLVDPVYDIDACIVKVTVFTEPAGYESNFVMCALRACFYVVAFDSSISRRWDRITVVPWF